MLCRKQAAAQALSEQNHAGWLPALAILGVAHRRKGLGDVIRRNMYALALEHLKRAEQSC